MRLNLARTIDILVSLLSFVGGRPLTAQSRSDSLRKPAVFTEEGGDGDHEGRDPSI